MADASQKSRCSRTLRTRGPSRRGLLLSVLWAGALASGAAIFGLGDPAQAQQKVSKEQAKYQDSPKDGHKCSECAYFEKPSACKIVEGDINPDGWCQLWTKAA
jgi:High potential iron-sulfur protein